MLILPTTKSEVNLDWKAQKIGMIGPSGIGKSEFFAQNEKTLFLETEAGLNHLKVFKVPIRDWNDVKEAYVALQTASDEGKLPYDLVVTDTIDRLVDYAEEDVVAMAKIYYSKMAGDINTIADVPNGAGWSKTRNKVMGFLNKMSQLNCAVSYIGHLQTKTITEGVRTYHRNTINMGGKLGLELLAWADHTLHIEAKMMGDRLHRVVWTYPTQSREAKSRGGIVPNGMKWGDSTKENFDAFRALFK